MKRTDSPVSNNGRGLKQAMQRKAYRMDVDSPVSNNGRGLKPCRMRRQRPGREIRPLAITGVD